MRSIQINMFFRDVHDVEFNSHTNVSKLEEKESSTSFDIQ